MIEKYRQDLQGKLTSNACDLRNLNLTLIPPIFQLEKFSTVVKL